MKIPLRSFAFSTLNANLPLARIYRFFVVLLRILVVFDFLATLFSVYIAGYAQELNPVVLRFSPFFALALNILYLFLFSGYKWWKFAPLLGSVFLYGYADLNHLAVFLDKFTSGMLDYSLSSLIS